MKRFTTDLIRALSQQHHRPQEHYRIALAEILSGITDQLARGHSLQLTTFGTFYTRERRESTLKDLRTGKQVHIAPRRVAAFRVGAVLKNGAEEPANREEGQRPEVQERHPKRYPRLAQPLSVGVRMCITYQGGPDSP